MIVGGVGGHGVVGTGDGVAGGYGLNTRHISPTSPALKKKIIFKPLFLKENNSIKSVYVSMSDVTNRKNNPTAKDIYLINALNVLRFISIRGMLVIQIQFFLFLQMK